jgi:hypothetical protein
MNFNNKITSKLSLTLSQFVFLLIYGLSITSYASSLDERRQIALNEVREIVSDEDLAKQIADIRLKRELAQEAQAKRAYVGVGSRIAIGYSEKINEQLAVRAEISGLDSFEQSKYVNETNFQFKEKNLSLGAYLDWFPTDSSFRLSAGVNINRMRTTLNGISGSNLNINGKQVSLGSDVYNVEFKFPTVTPYVGIGFGDFNNGDAGLHVYGDLGLMLGKYDAVAQTSLVGNQGVTTSDVDKELNNLRKSLYKWNFIPTATVGLTYRFN